MVRKANEYIRNTARAKGVRLWEVAARLPLSDANFSRKLRRELPDEERERILRIIDEIAAEEAGA